VTSPRRIVVLGGGITGLTAAYTLAQARRGGAPIEELLIEASDRLGGHLRTERVAGYVIEAGPDSFLAEKPEAAALCRELGLGDQLIGSNDAERRTYILHHGRLVPLPDGLMFLVPTRLWPTLWSPLLSFRSKAAILTELFTPRPNSHGFESAGLKPGATPGAAPGATAETDDPTSQDESVADFVRRHFGDSMLENIADPLLAGVYGGDSACLSVRAVLPRFWEMEQKYGSLGRGVLAARRQQRLRAAGSSGTSTGAEPAGLASRHPSEIPDAAGSAWTSKQISKQTGPLFMSLKDGLGRLVDALASRLETSRVRLGQRVLSIERGDNNGEGAEGKPPGGNYLVRCAGAAYAADAVILALPTYEGGRLLAPFDPRLGELLGGIPYTSALTVALGYDAASVRNLPPGFGFLVPHKENRRMLACTFVHHKFRHRVAPGKALLRCFLGGARDAGILTLDDDSIVDIIRSEILDIMNIDADPELCRVHRWPASMPQYSPGHRERVKLMGARADALPGIFLAGNAYSGIGISDCVRTGRAAAEQALRKMRGE